MDNFPQNVDNFVETGENVDNFSLLIHRVWITLFAYTFRKIPEFVRQFLFISDPPYYSSSIILLFFPLSILPHPTLRCQAENTKLKHVLLSWYLGSLTAPDMAMTYLLIADLKIPPRGKTGQPVTGHGLL